MPLNTDRVVTIVINLASKSRVRSLEPPGFVIIYYSMWYTPLQELIKLFLDASVCDLPKHAH